MARDNTPENVYFCKLSLAEVEKGSRYPLERSYTHTHIIHITSSDEEERRTDERSENKRSQ